MHCVSLFSGCGGLDLGLKQAGFTIVAACDNDLRCAVAHNRNFPETEFFRGSITDFVTRLRDGEIRLATEIDLIAGGPPCPPYSKSRFYRKDKPRGLKDAVGFETLNGYIDTVELLRPRAFLLENVPGFAYKVHREALDHLVETANSFGYTCSWQILNAADYGVPQTRERFILVGTLEGEFAFPSPTHAKEPGRDLLSAARTPWRTAGDVLSDLDTPENADDEGHFAGGQFHDLLCEIPPGDNYLFFTEKRGHPNPVFEWRSRYWSFLLKLSPELPSWTIQARRSNNMGPFHWRNRILRIDEIKRLQSFPDEFALTGTVEQQWRQIGNAVPPLLAAHVGRAIRDHLLVNCEQFDRAA